MGSEVTVMDPGSTWKTAWRLRLTVRPCFGRQVSFLFAFDGPAGSVAGRDRGVGGSTPARVGVRARLSAGLLAGPWVGRRGIGMGPLACCGCLRLGVLPWPLGCFPGLWAGLGPGGAASIGDAGQINNSSRAEHESRTW